jgi:triosephosphate isomerase
MRQLIAGNWKMNGLTTQAGAIAGTLRDAVGTANGDPNRPASGQPSGLACDLLVCPPFTQIATVAHMLLGFPVAIGGQDCHTAPHGAHTCDISAPMLRDAGATWVILGHSERRQTHAETDDLVREKVLAAAASDLTPIVCVGETADQRTAGQQTAVVGRQLAGSLPQGFGTTFAGVVAYEPIWAIGTGNTATAQDVATMHAFIRAALLRQIGEAGRGVRILYGGSVNPGNAAALLAVPEVGGALVGGASLKPEDFLAIAGAAHPARVE